jgi:hypothetical protein
MSTENNTVVQELDKAAPQADPKENAAPEKAGDPQGTPEQGENETEERRKSGWIRAKEAKLRAERERDGERAEKEYWRNVALQNAPKPGPEAKSEPIKMPVWADYERDGKQEQYFPDVAKAVAAEQLKAFRDEQKAESAKRETQTEQQKLQSEWAGKISAARDEFDDFDDVISLGNPTQNMLDTIMRLEQGAKVAYFLSSNPQEEARIRQLSDKMQDIELGRIEARLAQEKPAAAEEEINSEPPAKPLPKPPTPIQKSSSVTKRFDPLDPSSYGNDFTAYEKHMNERDKRKSQG